MNRSIVLLAAVLVLGGITVLWVGRSKTSPEERPAPPSETVEQPPEEGSIRGPRPQIATSEAVLAMGIASTNFLPEDFTGRRPETRELTAEEKRIKAIFDDPNRRNTIQSTAFLGPDPSDGDAQLSQPERKK